MKPSELVEQGRFLGEDFLIWLWWRGLVHGGTSGVEGDETACYVSDSFHLVGERGDVKTITLKDGNPSESREAFEALARGMRPAKAKIRLLAGDMEWVFTHMAATHAASGMKMPPVASKDPSGRLADRLFLLKEGFGHMDRRYRAFLEARSSEGEAMADGFRTWIRAGLTGVALEEETD